MVSEIASTTNRASIWRRVGVVVGGVMFCSLAVVTAVSFSASGRPSRVSAPSPPSASRNAAAVELGEVAAASAAEARLPLTNATDSWIEIASLKTSCPCLRVTLRKQRIAPHSSTEAMIRLDLAEEPSFVGGLCPEIQFFDAEGREIFSRIVNARVVETPRIRSPAIAPADAIVDERPDR